MNRSMGQPIIEPSADLTRTRLTQKPREKIVVEQLEMLTRVPALVVGGMVESLAPETLIVVYRACVRYGYRDLQELIIVALHRRMAPFVHRRLSRVPWCDSEERLDVEAELALRLVQEWGAETAETEFWEVRFWTCLRLRLIDVLRAVRNGRRQYPRLEEYGDTPGPDRLDILERIAIRMMLDELPPQFTRVLFLKYVEQRTDREIAQMLGVSERTVRNYVQRAKLMLADRYQEGSL